MSIPNPLELCIETISNPICENNNLCIRPQSFIDDSTNESIKDLVESIYENKSLCLSSVQTIFGEFEKFLKGN